MPLRLARQLNVKRLPAGMQPFAEDAALLITATAGGFVLHAIGVPAGWLTGGMLLVALVALVRPWQGPSNGLVNVGMVLSGALIGAAATPEAVEAAQRYPGSIAILVCSLVMTVAVTGSFLVWAGRWSWLDALLASAPGAVSAVMVIAREATDGLPRVAVIQFFRLFVLVAAIPSVLVLSGPGAVVALPVPAPPSWLDSAILIVAGFAAGFVLRKFGVVAPFVLGSTMASAALHASGLVHGTLVLPLAILAFIVLGGMIGARLGGLDRGALLRLMPLALGAFFTSVAVAALLAWPAAIIARVSYGTAFVAFAPGGLEAMALLAVVLGFDPLYVGAHHLVRFMAVGFLLPVAVKWVMARDARH